jgi:hypothetical protein
LEFVERLRFRLRPVSGFRVEADEGGTMMTLAPGVDDCCDEDDDSPEVDGGDDGLWVEVSRGTGGLSSKASPKITATTKKAPNATQRWRFKAIEVIG